VKSVQISSEADAKKAFPHVGAVGEPSEPRLPPLFRVDPNGKATACVSIFSQ